VEPAPAKAVANASDATLQQKIQDKLSKAKAGGGKFQVKVSQGTAYLSGRAEVAQHKGAATRMAKTAGAKRVVNNIVVSDAARQKARAASIRAAS
jgi:osmotically-inducible protein OsmY